MKILVVGSGGREHALCWALRQTARAPLQLYCAPGNDGIAELAQCVPIKATDIAALARFAADERIDLTVVGSEAPLAAGLVDEFAARGLAVAGPGAAAAQLEASKVFAKEFMARHRIPTARFRVAESAQAARDILRRGEFGAAAAPVVVKADGLAAGKGVVVAGSRAEAEAAVAELMEAGRVGLDAARRVVLEETLTGREASLLLWTDGKDYALMPAARDHKRVGEGDTGPNTGGMGAITAPDVLDDERLKQVVTEIVEPTLAGAQSDSLDFRGVLFIGLMLTPQGPQVLEYNVRFGDPEAQAILVRLESDLAEIFTAVAHGGLGATPVNWSDNSSACVVLAARGYPEQPEKGARIDGLAEAARRPGVQLFHAGTRRAADGSWYTNGGRVLGVTAAAPTLDRALADCYDTIQLITWDGMHYRRDVGKAVGSKR
ncbi:MAG: phosphoribosylamine--glycine ligase [Pyrinomonadaceae bacterium]